MRKNKANKRAPRRRDKVDDQLSKCTCGCGKDVSEKTQRRHWQELIAASKVDDTTKGILRNASPAPSFPSNVTPARKRGGSRSPSPKPKRLKRRKTRVVQSESEDEAAGPAHVPRVNEQSADGDSSVQHAAAGDTVDPGDPLGVDPTSNGGTPSPVSPGGAAAVPHITATPDNEDVRPGLDTFNKQRYRATVEDVEDEEESQNDSGSASDGDDDSDSQGEFPSDSESERDDDEFINPTATGPTVFERLNEQFEKELAEICTHFH
ncbi:hypothetical protein EXIGLDRAFT_700601 [Exidia glandulosa HHB12029]|uniref:Uncharacterized protein n=1 Tax=Exidia glandulosa HHB12029 TaxID=1314781 RepID=A0A165M2W6_EXIGL|nr:hypothetical protein EXIGLDRAFT_700601 [Exidia glandulosa HHB12029]